MSKPIATLLTAAAVTIGLMSHPGSSAAAPAANAYAHRKCRLQQSHACARGGRLAWRWVAWRRSLARWRLGLLRWRICRRRHSRRNAGRALLLSAPYYPAPAITTMPRQMAPLTIACDGSGHTIPGAAPISATTATDILVRDGFFVGYVRIDIGCVSNSWIGMARCRSSRRPRM